MSTPPPPPPQKPASGGTSVNRLQESSPSRGSLATNTGQGLARNPSLRSARPIRKGAARTSMGPDSVVDEDTKAANAQLIADLKEQVERAEAASEHYRKQLEAMQARLDEVSNETTAAEEREFQFRTQIDKLKAEVRESARQTRELELSYESEKKLLLQDRENRSNRETELQSVVNRLTENLKFKNQELVHTNRKGSPDRIKDDDDNTASESSVNGGQDYLRILEQKDSTIESLRLELADFHLKMAEQEHVGDGRSQALEKQVLDIKMRNARLQEENESFQMLLSEKTLKGDFMHDTHNLQNESANSLAEELQSAEESLEATPDGHKKLEIENKTLKDSNKALTLYIDKIIGRLLKHEGFERIITDKDDDDAPTPLPPRTLPDKALPDLPAQDYFTGTSPDSSRPPTATAAIANATSAAAGFLQRARSVVSRPAAPRSRPVSYVPAAPTANENPDTAPSIPINRSHRRARSDQANDVGAAAVVQQMNRGSPLRTTSGGGPISPGIGPLSPASSNRLSYFGLSSVTTASNRASSGSGQPTRPVSSSNSIVSDHSQDVERDSTDASSARASIHSAAGGAIPGAVMKQNQLRPLRLVQEQAQVDEESIKKANRGSWMGWFNKGPNEPAPE